MSDAQNLLGVAVEAARMAGERLARRARAGAETSVSSKSTPTDLVSEADVDSERAIRELLRERRPHDGFVGEETEVARETGDSGYSWVVDPLDGTVNFVFGIPQWSVSVAVRDARGTVAGAIYDPNRDELFCAYRDGPARLSGSEGESELRGRVRAVTPSTSASSEHALAAAMVATGLYYDARVREAQGKVLERLVGRVRDIRRFGSAALDLAWTAMGRYDAYFERGVKQWDIAAGALICERAGLSVRELPEQHDLPWGILVAPDELIEPLFELVAGA
ncbi:MAG TPA: inositol monophosphatase family protein [Solirubrobacteraceae bacterium]|jgi:myo-inositol-1(or 4)-monophosphatase|nr:inositol monophosphatase family protein [Solirubrobacteraceae bacterium]